jgi:hypothetical protein
MFFLIKNIYVISEYQMAIYRNMAPQIEALIGVYTTIIITQH